MEQRKKSLAELSSGWLLAKIKEYKIPLLASFLFGMLAYGFTFTNKLINHDDAFTMFAKGGTIELGRWGLNICRRLFPNFSMPWIYGIITIAFVSAAICLIIHIFQVKNKLLQILIAGNIIVFPALTSVFTFMFTSSSYGLSIFMAVLAAALMKRPRKLTVILALGFMVFSLSIYQAYITIAAGLLVLILIQELLQGRELKAVLLKGLLYVAFLVVSLGIYYAATQFILRWKGYSFSAYADNSMSFSIAELPGKALDAYKYFFRFIFDGNLSLVPTPLSTRMHTNLLYAVVGLAAFWCVLRKGFEPLRVLFLAALTAVLPLACNCMYLFSPAVGVHTLMVYGFICFYLLVVILADTCVSALTPGKCLDLIRRLSLDAVAVILALILATNVYIANETSLYQFLQYENTYSFYTSLAADIMMQPEFDENTRLAVIGSYNPTFDYFPSPFVYFLNGANEVTPNMYSNYRFVEYFIGFPITFVPGEELDAIRATAEFEEMAVYPYYGSIRMIGDTVVVKLSE